MLSLRSDQLDIRDRSSGRWDRARRFVAEHGPLEVWRLVRSHGARASAAFILRNIRYLVASCLNRRFDRRFAVDTSGDIPVRFLDVVSDNKPYGSAFLSTPAATFRRVLRLLPPDLGQFAFVDVGAGKGRVLLLAANREFRRIVGVEYARDLVACAQRNFATYRNPEQRCRDLACVCADATTFELPSEKCVIYFLRPFEDNVMARMMQNIRRSYEANRRKLFLVFVSPNEPQYAPPHHLLNEGGFLRLRFAGVLPFDWGAVTRFQVALYESHPV